MTIYRIGILLNLFCDIGRRRLEVALALTTLAEWQLSALLLILQVLTRLPTTVLSTPLEGSEPHITAWVMMLSNLARCTLNCSQLLLLLIDRLRTALVVLAVVVLQCFETVPPRAILGTPS